MLLAPLENDSANGIGQQAAVPTAIKGMAQRANSKLTFVPNRQTRYGEFRAVFQTLFEDSRWRLPCRQSDDGRSIKEDAADIR